MATGYIRNDTTNNITNGNLIDAADLDGEFDAIQAAMDATTGHAHDGTLGGGAPILSVGPVQDIVITTSVLRPKVDNTVDLGTSTFEFKDMYLDGTAQVDTLQVDESATISANLIVNGNTTLGNVATDTVTITADIASNLIPSADNTHDLGSATDEWRNIYVDGIAQVDTLQVDESATITADLTVNGNTTLGNTNTDTVTIAAELASSLIPSVDNSYDLGSAADEWRNLYVDGTAQVDTLQVDESATIAANLTVNGNIILGNADTDTVIVTADVASNLIPSADNTYDLGAIGSEWKDLYITGTANIDTLVADTVTISAGSITGITDLAVADGGTGASDAAGARTNLGLGTISTQAASSVTITGGSITGITDLAVADGGTGASDAAGARANFGLGTVSTQSASSVSITGGSITGITDLAVADGGTGASNASDARANLGLGTISTQSASSVNITGGSITGITDLAVADGGTGASNASDARTNLGLGTAATTNSSAYVPQTGLTGSAGIPSGTQAQRDGTPDAGYFRFNTDVAKFEGYNGSSWGSVGGGATGGGADDIFIQNGQTVTTNYTIPADKNAMSTGPITINSGVTVTVSTGARYVVI